ncbi:choice-of-anchor Q domain-containing protein [Dokdonella sp. MW10]|uniref:choice-of-anchor Q domain-containing protein n=1 Tax=Dokdonella sp. MW10 TaxID=2992926 RepID=UPI003F7DE7E8
MTIAGAGPDATHIVTSTAASRFEGSAAPDLVLQDLRLTTASDAVQLTAGALTLRNVTMPSASNFVGIGDEDGSVSVTLEDSRIASAVAGSGAHVDVRARDSVLAALGVVGDTGTLEVDRVRLEGAAPATALTLIGGIRARVRDSVVTGYGKPLEVIGVSNAVDARFTRTRFSANTGPMTGSGGGMVTFDDSEFRNHVVDSAHLQQPAVLRVDDTVAWRFNRVLFAGHRGGGGGDVDGAVIGVLPGGNLAMTNVTFADNTFRSGVSGGIGHVVGVRSTAAAPAIAWITHATMRRATSLTAATPGSLLTVDGAGSSVRLFNTILDGTCAFSSGGGVLQAVGNLESTGSTCGLSAADNDTSVPASQLRIGSLVDVGGFAQAFLPAISSVVIDAAHPTWCLLGMGLDQRRHVRPSGGAACDIGAIEAGAPADTIFASVFD